MGDVLKDQPVAATGPGSSTTIAPALRRVPRATYRLQLRSDFGLDAVRQLLPYLSRPRDQRPVSVATV